MKSPSMLAIAVALVLTLASSKAEAQACQPAPGTGKVQVHEQADHTSPSVNSIDFSQPVERTGRAKTFGSGVSAEEWFEIRQGALVAWAPGAQVICRFSPEEAGKALSLRARETFAAIKLRNYARLAQIVHPKGVRFSPYGYVDTSINPVLTRKQVAGLGVDPRRRVWGNEDGSGEPLRLTFAQYFRKFVWDRDYTRPAKLTFNAAARPGGTTLERLWEVFPNATLVNAYFPGSDPEGGAMDWSGLWLAFERIGDVWYLTGIVHDAWTV